MIGVVVLLAWASSAPDVVVLEDGSRLVGEVVGERPSEFELVGVFGRSVLTRSEVREVRGRDQFASVLDEPVAERAVHATLQLARFALDRGLYDDAFDLADHALRDERLEAVQREQLLDRLARQAVLARSVPAMEPSADTLESWLRIAAGPSAARAEVARTWLRNESTSTWFEVAEQSLDDDDAAVRAQVVQLLEGRADPRSRSLLVQAALLDDAEPVRENAVQALEPFAGDREVLGTFARATGSAKPQVRMASYAAMATLGNPRAMAPLIGSLALLQSSGAAGTVRSHIYIGEQRAYLADFEVEIAQGAVVADPQIGILNTGAVLDVRVAGTSSSSIGERARLIGALEELSGRDFGDDVELWATWWEDNKQQLLTAWEEQRAGLSSKLQHR